MTGKLHMKQMELLRKVHVVVSDRKCVQTTHKPHVLQVELLRRVHVALSDRKCVQTTHKPHVLQVELLRRVHVALSDRKCVQTTQKPHVLQVELNTLMVQVKVLPLASHHCTVRISSLFSLVCSWCSAVLIKNDDEFNKFTTSSFNFHSVVAEALL
jgi:hypothetical protein